ncbi:MAG TPA: tRNA 2-thiouridine(34) synthase MnmA [Polyangiaceae bacterium]|jgi:tRNA-specific 2-thiouridylase|nr:tRNA 2-thiouridine(34) synthase MnmA [Polyangiaceae bacterium]
MEGRVLVAMSGGVDSSVAAARLVRSGWDVVGVTLHLWDYPDDGSVRGRCCAPEDVYDARRVADVLGIPHFAFDRRELFEREVVTPFVEDYLRGATPSPCVRCNRGVKMKELFALAERLDARWVATGHYARIAAGPPLRLRRARDTAKDQSYFLDSLRAKDLERLMLPLGDATKAEVRDEALLLDLPGAQKGESQELCFVPTGRYDELVAKRAGDRARPGPIVDDAGRTLGQHDGLFRFTVGQRKNLGVATGSRAYVVKLDADTATVHLGTREALLARGARLGDVTLHDGVALPLRAGVAVRYRAEAVPARIVASDSGVEVLFDTPVPAVTPGQRAVFYDGEAVVGAGTIVSSIPDETPHAEQLEVAQ